MRGAGALNIVLGVISLVVGIAAGVLLIISGGKLISGKSVSCSEDKREERRRLGAQIGHFHIGSALSGSIGDILCGKRTTFLRIKTFG